MPVDAASTVVDLADEVWTHVLVTDPYMALRAGVTVERLPHGSIAEARREAELGRAIRDRLRAVDASTLSGDDRDTAALLEHVAQDWCDAEQSWWTRFPVAPYQSYGLAMSAPQALASIAFDDPATDVERYLSLASDLAGWADAARERLAGQAGRGWGAPRAALPGFADNVARTRGAVQQWLTGYDARAAGLSAAHRGALDDGVARVLDSEILPAFDRLAEHLAGPAGDTAVDGVGLGQYPGGDEAYRRLVRSYASFDISPEQVHRLGLEQVEELTEKLAEVRGALNFDGDEAAYRRRIEADPRFHAGSPDEVAQTYRRHMARMDPIVRGWFAVLPAAPYGTERLDPALEAGMSYGFYEPPTPANPTGRYRYNGSGLGTRSQVNAATLIFHELVPGHHFHLARQGEDASLHPVRAELAPMALGAYTEGWAEYAASLGVEMGLYDDVWDRYGHYLHQRFTAQRLVVDTGLNAFGWSLERAAEYMSAHTLESPEQVRTETLRYSTDIPGQALGYRLGCLRFWEMRRQAAERMGTSFDVRDFHEIVLGAGALPLTAVQDNVTRFAGGPQS